jgi:hypothetical protein
MYNLSSIVINHEYYLFKDFYKKKQNPIILKEIVINKNTKKNIDVMSRSKYIRLYQIDTYEYIYIHRSIFFY